MTTLDPDAARPADKCPAPTKLSPRPFSSSCSAARRHSRSTSSVHISEETHAAVTLDALAARPQVTVLTRGDSDQADRIRDAVARALNEPHPHLDEVETYRQSESGEVVHLDPYGVAYETPQPPPRTAGSLALDPCRAESSTSSPAPPTRS